MFRVVIRAAQRHSSWIEQQCGVTGAQLWIMQELFETPGLRVGEVAQRLAIHQTTTSNLLDALVKRGLISKIRDVNDQRVVKLVLSQEGAALVRKAPQPARGLLPEALRKMPAQDLAALGTGLQALIEAIELHDDGQGMLPLPFTM